MKKREKRNSKVNNVNNVKVCWHCGASGHEKKVCLEYYLEIATVSLVPYNTNPAIREIVKDEARRVLEAALEEGKEGGQLKFGGAPWQLSMTWPLQSPPPVFPTNGVWYGLTYYGDDT